MCVTACGCWRKILPSPRLRFSLSHSALARTARSSASLTPFCCAHCLTNPEQLMMVWENATHLGFPKNTPSPANFLDWRRQTTVFESMAAFAERSFNLTGVGEPERLDGRRVSANLFGLLGVRPIIGRTFVPQEAQPGTKVVLLHESLWKRRFGGDPNVLGRALTL